MTWDVIAPRQYHWERDAWNDEEHFTQALISDIESSEIQSKCVEGTKLTADRLSERRSITDVVYDKSHPHSASAGRPDIAVYYEGDPLPQVHGRVLSNPFFIECKFSSRVTENLPQALRYKWRNGETDLKKYSGDSVGMAAPEFFTTTNFRSDDGTERFHQERQLWHTGLGALRNGIIPAGKNGIEVPGGLMTFNEEEVVVFHR